MFQINEDKSIYLTRGDIANIGVTAKDADGGQYVFKAGDVVRLQVFKRKDCSEVVLSKSVTVEAETTEVTIYIDHNDTKFGGLISKPTNYWYEVELNPERMPQTLIGYDDEGEKILRLFPEGGEA